MEPEDRPAGGASSSEPSGWGGGSTGSGGASTAGGFGDWAAPDSPAPTTSEPWGGPATGAPPTAAPPAPGSASGLGPAPAGPGTPDAASVLRPVPLRPMTLSDLLDGAFRVLKARPRTVLGIAGAILIPVFLVGAFLQRDATHGYTLGEGASFGQVLGQTGRALVLAYAAAAIEAASLFFLGGALARLITSWYAGGDLDAGQALGAAFRRTPALLGAFAMLLPVKVVAGALCYLPLLAVVPLFSVTAPAIVVEGLGPYAGAKRSVELVARRFWWCVLIVVVATIGATVLTLALTTLPQLVLSALPDSVAWVFLGLLHGAVAMVVITTLTSVSVLLYVDLRIRTEGLDLELGAADAFAHAG